jgi:putative ABC transport system permease protein
MLYKQSHNNRVRSVSGSVQPLGQWTKQLVIKAEGKDETVQSISALPGFATQLGIPILKGRDLNPKYPLDQTDAILVNQAFLKQMRWTTGIGKNITYQNHRYQVVGEVNDFHYQDFQTPVGPLLILGCKPTDVAYVYAKTSSGLFSTANTSIEAVWKKVNPNLPFEYHYQELVFDEYFRGFVQTSQVTGAASVKPDRDDGHQRFLAYFQSPYIQSHQVFKR